MSIPEDSKFNTGLIISKYSSKDIVPLLPLLAIEFPDWSLKKIKSYIDIVIEGKNDVSANKPALKSFSTSSIVSFFCSSAEISLPSLSCIG